jgi:hypothetical protein
VKIQISFSFDVKQYTSAVLISRSSESTLALELAGTKNVLLVLGIKYLAPDLLQAELTDPSIDMEVCVVLLFNVLKYYSS